MRVRSNMGIISRVVRTGANTSPTPRGLYAVPAPLILLLGLILSCARDPAPDEERPPEPHDAAAVSDTSAAPAAPDTSQAGQSDDVEADRGAQWTSADTHVERSIAGAGLLREMRIARHDGFDRIVLEFGDHGVPGYRVAYVDRPVRQCGSGDVVALAGDAWLSITVEPADAHTEAGEPTVRDRERAPRLPALLEVKLICDFEAVVEVVAGVTAPERYRAFVLTAPDRLVIDVMHPAS